MHADLRHSSNTCSNMRGESTTGRVFAMAHTVVKPPAAAARVPDSIVSLSGNPGNRRCVWRSTKPGHTIRPVASITCAPAGAGAPEGTICAMRPFSTRTSASRSIPAEGSMTRPERKRRGGGASIIDSAYPTALQDPNQAKGAE